MKNNSNCPFCKLVNSKEILMEDDYVFAIEDSYPVTPGHTLIIPKRHFDNYFDINKSERKSVEELLKKRRKQLLELDKTIEGFNIGVNIGESAGQTIMHCHVHLIPRRIGDTINPRGGVRGVIPEKMNY
jgi:ATP adenylyltransferase